MRRWRNTCLSLVLALPLVAACRIGAAPPDDEDPIDSPYLSQVWLEAMGGSNNDRLFDVTATSDGGAAATGYTFTYGAGHNDVLVVKLDAAGEILWARTLGGEDYEEGRSIIETYDGGLVVAGYTNSFPGPQDSLLLCKFGSNGDYLWSRVLKRDYTPPGGALDFRSYDLIEDSDHDLLVTGDILRANPTRHSLFLAAFDHDGTWLDILTVVYSPVANRSHYGYGLAEMCGNEGYLVAGRADGDDIGEDILLVKFHRSCSYDWAWWIAQEGNGDPERALSLVRTDDCGFALAGLTGEDLVILRRDDNVNPIWSKRMVQGASEGHAVCQVADGGLVVAGVATADSSDLLLAKWDVSGQIQWSRSYGTPAGTEWGYGVVEGAMDNLWAVGRTTSWGAGGTDALALRAYPSGLTCLEPEEGPTSQNWTPLEGVYIMLGWTPPMAEQLNWIYPTVTEIQLEPEVVCHDICPADLTCDGQVNTADLLILLGAWGTPEGDIDGDGDTDTADLLALLAAWGECP